MWQLSLGNEVNDHKVYFLEFHVNVSANMYKVMYIMHIKCTDLADFVCLFVVHVHVRYNVVLILETKFITGCKENKNNTKHGSQAQLTYKTIFSPFIIKLG